MYIGQDSIDTVVILLASHLIAVLITWIISRKP